jgi:7-dehydrocholesterol reductase
MTKSETKELTTWGEGGLFGNRVIGSFILTLGTPIFIVLLTGTCVYYEGSFTKLSKAIYSEGLIPILLDKFPSPFNLYAWEMIFTFIAYQLALMRIVPGKEFKATITPTGFVPTYTANGVECYLITLFTLFALDYYKLWNPADVYDHMGELLLCSNILALLLCIFLTFKGLYFPSTKDAGTNGHWIVDFFWGTELYPSVFGFSIKQVTNCRYGMMLWQMLIICYAYKQYSLFGYITSSMFVSVFIQTVYIFKFFYWETGYFCTMDIQHDRAGYYICWGCMMWVPCVYTLHTFYLTTHPVLLSLPATLLLTAAGVFFVWANYDCDRFYITLYK